VSCFPELELGCAPFAGTGFSLGPIDQTFGRLNLRVPILFASVPTVFKPPDPHRGFNL
jgi:hypothetical protein